MNECDQIHPLLRGYLQETISASQRRIVARHLNLCASSRKEIEKLRQGPVKLNLPLSEPNEPWDIKILRWLFKMPKPAAVKLKEVTPPKKADKPLVERKPSAWKPILGVLVFFGAMVFLTHFVQNAGENPLVKNTKRWISQKGWHLFGINPSLELVLDLSSLPHWTGDYAPVAFPYQEMISDADHFKIYWQLLEPGLAMPKVDFSENSLVVVFLGPKTMEGHTVRFKRAENYTDKTILWYDEVNPASGEMASARPWVLQQVPKPAQQPVLIQPIQ
ncbi:MAG TPA: hypothetical protein VK791_05190 [bacterium]|jgi:hypothetical protein|nr:hypothetical protein [bacterium]